MKKYVMLLAIIVLALSGMQVSAVTGEGELLEDYKDYEERFAEVASVKDISKKGFQVIEEQIFPVLLESFGEQELQFVPAMEPEYHRLLIFVVDAEGNVVYKCNQLATNQLYKGSMEQPTEGIAAVAFQDVNGDELTDIILITTCRNQTGEYAGKQYKTGDVLFQQEGDFYRDYRISDKINRFGMNRSAHCIVSFVRDGQSTEILYTAATEEELLKNGFDIIEEQCYRRNFEKLGKLRVVPGIFSISEYNVFMIYLVNEHGDIVWSFQPMGDYDILYALKGVACKDVDGDGMKDLVVLAKYSKEGRHGELLIETECAIYYQRTGGFDIDTGFGNYYQCTEETTMEELVPVIRGYWGWSTE